MVLRSLILVALLITSLPGQACPRNFGFSGFEDPIVSSEYKPYAEPVLGKMDEETFDRALDLVEEIYQDFLGPAGIKFSVKKDYQSDYQNAHPGREGEHWFIEMHGGFFRNQAFETYEMVALVGCHEVGHHLGETAYYPSVGWEWASAEGQSDYFATLKCMRKVFADDDNIQWVKDYPLDIPATVTEQCESVWKTQEEAAICIRSSMSSFHRRFSSSPLVSFDTPLQVSVNETHVFHPNSQCRLDTNFQGALCVVDENINTSQEDEKAGNCNADQHDIGIRPGCWYKAPEA